jgi:hypothetical protein
MKHLSIQLRHWALATAVALSAGTVVLAGETSFEFQAGQLQVRNDGQVMKVSLQSPALTIDGRQVAGVSAIGDTANPSGENTWEISYPDIPLDASTHLEIKSFLQWSARESVLRRWSRLRTAGGTTAPLLQEVVLDRVDLQGMDAWTHGTGEASNRYVLAEGPQSHPFFATGQFMGIEFPVSATRCADGAVLLAHRPGRKLQPGQWYQTRTAIRGMAAAGEEVGRFQEYIQSNRPKPDGFHVNYNSWWTSPVPYREADIVGLMKMFDDGLYKAHGVPFDTFCIDMGWSNPKTLWGIDAQQFPNGFKPLQEAAAKMNARLGLWISPSSYYPPALDNDWAQSQGFEATTIRRADGQSQRLLCLGGKQYAAKFRQTLVEMATQFGVSHIKLDGINLECTEKDHGHEPGAESSEAIAEGLIEAVAAARQANPLLWAESTCFGYNPSPWWLFHVNSVIGTFGDDSPVGRVPCPVYRESATTARDFFNLQGAQLLPVPTVGQEVLGIIHQTNDPLLNDAVMVVMRGHMFLPLYVNPKYMDDARWKSLAALLRWARQNADLLSNTRPLLPPSWQNGSLPHLTDAGTMPREPYGYAHVKGGKALIAVRNPWIAPQSYSITLNRQLGFTSDLSNAAAVCIYPEHRDLAGGLKNGDTLKVQLNPYETVVISLENQTAVASPGLPAGPMLEAVRCEHQLERVQFKPDEAALGPNWTSRVGDSDSAVRFTLKADIRVAASSAELLVLYEGKTSPGVPIGTIKLDNKDAEAETISSAAGWSATGLPAPEHWTFLRVPVSKGEHAVAIEQYVTADVQKISAWLHAFKPGNAQIEENGLPQPERISLDGIELMQPQEVAAIPASKERMSRPVERIQGIFLDAIEPVSVKQGWGTLQKNRSVWEKPMMIAGRQFLRGLGTHAPSHIRYALDGQFKRFQCWAGADSATSPTIKFEVRVDGVTKWQSELMTRDKAPVFVDVEISGAKSLELIVDEMGNFGADHADWADARLLK